MRKFKKLTSIIMVLVLLVGTFAACDTQQTNKPGSTASSSSLLDIKVPESKGELSEKAKMDISGDCIDINDYHMVIVKNEGEDLLKPNVTTTVYNYLTGSIVFKSALNYVEMDLDSDKKNPKSVNITLNDNGAFTVGYTYTNGDTATDLRDVNGSKIADLRGTKTLDECGVDIYRFGRLGYEIKDGVVTKVFDFEFCDTLPDFDKKVGEQYIYASDESIKVYDKNFSLVDYYEISGVDIADSFVLSNGNVFVQGYTYLPDDANSYDVYIGAPLNTKVKISSFVYDIVNKKVVNLKNDYVVTDVIDARDYTEICGGIGEGWKIFDDSVTDIVELSYIKDKRVSDHTDYALANTGMKILGKFDDILPNMEFTISPIANDMAEVYNIAGEVFAINSAGKILGVRPCSAGYGNGFMYTQNCIYDLDGNLIYDYEAEGYSFIGQTPSGLVLGISRYSDVDDIPSAGEAVLDNYNILLYSEIVVYDVTTKSTTTLYNEKDALPMYRLGDMGDNYYMITDVVSDKQSLKNYKGEALISKAVDIEIVYECEDASLIVKVTTSETGLAEYYIVK